MKFDKRLEELIKQLYMMPHKRGVLCKTQVCYAESTTEIAVHVKTLVK